MGALPESFTSLSNAGFSMIKQEVISRLKFRVTVGEDLTGSRAKREIAAIEEGFDVVFP